MCVGVVGGEYDHRPAPLSNTSRRVVSGVSGVDHPLRRRGVGRPTYTHPHNGEHHN